jgi:hypothetical protein
VIGSEIVDQADDLVGEKGQRPGNLFAIRLVRIETTADLRTSMFHRCLQQVEEFSTDLLRRDLAGDKLIDLADKSRPVDDAALFRNSWHLLVTNFADH